MKIVLHGGKDETLLAKIKYMLSLPLAKRYEMCLAKGELARTLERNQEKLYGRRGFKHMQILTLKDVARPKKRSTKATKKKAK